MGHEIISTNLCGWAVEYFLHKIFQNENRLKTRRGLLKGVYREAYHPAHKTSSQDPTRA